MIETNLAAESRNALPLEMNTKEFRALGYRLVDQVAELLGSLPSRPVTLGESPRQIRAILGDARLPERQDRCRGHYWNRCGAFAGGALAFQRPSALYGIHHVARRSVGSAGRVAGRGRESQRR